MFIQTKQASRKNVKLHDRKNLKHKIQGETKDLLREKVLILCLSFENDFQSQKQKGSFMLNTLSFYCFILYQL